MSEKPPLTWPLVWITGSRIVSVRSAVWTFGNRSTMSEPGVGLGE